MVSEEQKAYVVVRSDMSPGYQIVQSAHAVAEHEKAHPGTMAGQTMIVLSIPNQTLLVLLYEYLRKGGCEVTIFWEPDVAGYTAMAISPGDYSVLRGMPLAGGTK